MSWRHHAPVPMTQTSDGKPVPAEMQVVEHTVGYTEVVLSNGDKLRLHLYVDKFTYNVDDNSYTPAWHVVTELQFRKLAAHQVAGMLQDCWRC